MEYLSHANLSDTDCDRLCPMIFRYFLIIKELISHDSMLTLTTEILYLFLGKLNFSTWKGPKTGPNPVYKCAKIFFQRVLCTFENRTLQLEIYLYLKENKAWKISTWGPRILLFSEKEQGLIKDRNWRSPCFSLFRKTSKKRKVKTAEQHTLSLSLKWNTLMKQKGEKC